MPRKLFPHIAILLSNMYIVFFVLDRFNSAMQFINNDITKVLLLILAGLSIANSVFLIRDERRRIATEERARRERLRSARAARPARPAARN